MEDLDILDEIKKVFKNSEETPLFYVESGSRLWGFPGIDSDFDVRGIHLLSKKQAYDFRKKKDLIEIMEGDFDFVSFSLDKMFSLLCSSNPTVFEWIRAHIIYFNQLPKWEEFKIELCENFNFIPLYYHYLSLSSQQLKLIETKKKSTYKVVLYAIRGIFSAKSALYEQLPSLKIKELFNQINDFSALKDLAGRAIDKKLSQAEKTPLTETEHKEALRLISDSLKELEAIKPAQVNKEKRTKLGNILNDYAYFIKDSYYK